MSNYNTENDLTMQVSNQKEVLVKEQCCTTLSICLTNEGKFFSTFAGAHNKQILKELKKHFLVYYKSISKKLKNQTEDVVNNLEPVEEDHKKGVAKYKPNTTNAKSKMAASTSKTTKPKTSSASKSKTTTTKTRNPKNTK